MRKLTVGIMAACLVAGALSASVGTAQAAVTPKSAMGCTGIVDEVCLWVFGSGDNVQAVSVSASDGLEDVTVEANVGDGIWEILATTLSVSNDSYTKSWAPNGFNVPSDTTQICAVTVTSLGAYTPCIGVHP
jgi:hypothetical protein